MANTPGGMFPYIEASWNEIQDPLQDFQRRVEQAIFDVSPLGSSGGTVTASGGVQATGGFTVDSLPADGDTITLNGAPFTFRTSATTATEIQIGANTSLTAANAASTFNASTDPLVIVATYSSGFSHVGITYDTPGTIGNSYSLAKVSSHLTLDGANLTGGLGPLFNNQLVKGTGGSNITAADLSGDVTTSGSMVTTIANQAVTLAKMANIATNTFLGRSTAGTGSPEVLSVTTARTMLGISGFTGFADPTVQVGLTVVNGSATTAMRSDAAPALNQGISPSWSGSHTFQNPVGFLNTAPAAGIGMRISQLALPTDSYGMSIDVGGTGTGYYRAGRFYAENSGSANIPDHPYVIGVSAYGRYSGSGRLDFGYALESDFTMTGTGHVEQPWGAWNRVTVFSGTVGAAIGTFGGVAFLGSSSSTSVNSNACFHARFTKTSSAVLPNITGVRIDLWSNSGGTVTESVGISADPSIDVGVQRYFIKSTSTSPSLFSGDITGTALGLGTDPTAFIPLKVVKTLANSSPVYGTFVDVTNSSAGAFSSLTGVFARGILASSSSSVVQGVEANTVVNAGLSAIAAAGVSVANSISGSPSSVYGMTISNQIQATATVNNTYGVFANTVCFTSGVTAFAYGVYSKFSSSGTMTGGVGTAISYYSGAWATTGITNGYGLYIDSTSVDRATGTKFAIYSLALAPSLLSGDLTVSGLLKTGTTPVTLTNAAGNLLAPGSTTQVVFNDAGVFGSDAGMIYDKATDALTVAGTLNIKPGSRSYVVSVDDPSGAMRFSRSDVSGTYLQTVVSSSSVSLRGQNTTNNADFIFALTGGKVIMTPTEAGGAGLIQFGRRVSDSSTAVGASVEFWTITSQATPAWAVKAPGGASNIVAMSATGSMTTATGSIGIGTLTPRRGIDSLSTSVPQLRLSYTDNSVYADLQVGSGGTLVVSPTGNIEFSTVGKQINPALGYSENLGMLTRKYLTLHAAELWVETLVAQNTIATIGGRILVSPTNTLIADLASGTLTMDVKYNNFLNAAGGTPSGGSPCPIYMEANGSVEFMNVTSGPTTITGGFRYTITRNLDGSGANNWSAGDAVVSTPNGFIDLYSIGGIKNGIGPAIVGNFRNSTTYNDWSEHWAIGNLNGLYGYGANTWGVGLGKYAAGASHLTVDATNGIRIYKDTNTIIGQWSAAGVITVGEVAAGKSNTEVNAGSLSIRLNTVTKFNVDTTGNLRIGTDTTAASTTGFFVSNASQTYNAEGFLTGDVLIGDNTSASNFGNIKMTAAGIISIRRGVTDYITLSSTDARFTNVIRLLDTTSALSIGLLATIPTGPSGGTGIWLDRTGLFGLSGGIPNFKIDATNGNITAIAGSVGGWTLASSKLSSGAGSGINLEANATPASNKIYIGTGTYANTNTAFYVDGSGRFSLKNTLTWDGTTLSIPGGAIQAGTITARELLIGNFDNLVQDPGGENGGTGWTFGTGWSNSGGTGHSGSRYFSNSTILSSIAYNPLFADCKPGDKFYAEAWVATSGTGSPFVVISWYDSSKALLSTSNGSGSAGTYPSFGLSTVTATAPASAQYARCGVSTPASGIAGWFADDLYMRRMVEGSIVVDGTITAAKITVTSLSALTASMGNLTIDQILTLNGASGAITIGDPGVATIPSSATAGTGMWIDRSVFSGLAASKQTFSLASATGIFKLGSDLSAAATTAFAMFGTAPSPNYNGEALGAGDLLIGDNSSSKANIRWNKSAGQLQFRGGTTVNAYIHTDGSIKAGAGAVTINAAGVTLTPGTLIAPEYALDWKLSSDIVGQVIGYYDNGGANNIYYLVNAATTQGTVNQIARAQLLAGNPASTKYSMLTLQSIDSSAGAGAWLYGLNFYGLVIGGPTNTNHGPFGMLEVIQSGANSNAMNDVFVMSCKYDSGSPTANFGGAIKVQLETSTTEYTDAVLLGSFWTTATHASRTSAFVIQTVNSAAALADTLRVAPGATGIRFGQYGAGALSTDASGNISASSDERLKHILGPYRKGLAELRSINPILHKWNEKSGLEMDHIYPGFSAQNLLDAGLTESIFTTSAGYYNLWDRGLIAALVNAVKELDATVMQQKHEIERLKRK